MRVSGVRRCGVLETEMEAEEGRGEGWGTASLRGGGWGRGVEAAAIFDGLAGVDDVVLGVWGLRTVDGWRPSQQMAHGSSSAVLVSAAATEGGGGGLSGDSCFGVVLRGLRRCDVFEGRAGGAEGGGCECVCGRGFRRCVRGDVVRAVVEDVKGVRDGRTGSKGRSPASRIGWGWKERYARARECGSELEIGVVSCSLWIAVASALIRDSGGRPGARASPPCGSMSMPMKIRWWAFKVGRTIVILLKDGVVRPGEVGCAAEMLDALDRFLIAPCKTDLGGMRKLQHRCEMGGTADGRGLSISAPIDTRQTQWRASIPSYASLSLARGDSDLKDLGIILLRCRLSLLFVIAIVASWMSVVDAAEQSTHAADCCQMEIFLGRSADSVAFEFEFENFKQLLAGSLLATIEL
ncbi:hypothetical protein R3P38DRAFT_2811404 [Favolaschia claudopus]|uniref:Uncharacterized protein n=1 Tax=Favolaschia claudopus TaxID=2862362 RepID=A0AAV9Z9M1_9AGAR